MKSKILTKASVLDAAKKIISEEGMDQCSMRRISGGLGVAVGTLYNYYESREALLMDLFAVCWNEIVEKAASVVDPSYEPFVQLDRFFDIIKEDVTKPNGLGKAIFVFSNQVNDSKVTTLNFRRELQLVVESILNQKEGRGEVNKVLSQWIMTVFIDSLINEREATDAEKSMLSQVIHLDFEI